MNGTASTPRDRRKPLRVTGHIQPVRTIKADREAQPNLAWALAETEPVNLNEAPLRGIY
jgi:hypothetical protein